MQTIDNDKFGKFIAELRTESGLTQKEVGEKIGISDKAVSKWERGLSLPDISLLDPLAKLFNVSITEIIHGERILEDENLSVGEIDNLLSSSIQLTMNDLSHFAKRQKIRNILFITSVLLTVIEIEYLYVNSYIPSSLNESILLILGLCFIFGVYLNYFVKLKLPSYYDNNKINYYTDGIFKLHIAGIHFNNSNWEPIIHANCIVLSIYMVIIPILLYFYSAHQLFPFAMMKWIMVIPLIIGLVLPTWIIAKRYE